MVSVLVAPNSTVSNTGWTLVGGADVHECINHPVEAPDDATYVQDTADGDTFEVGLPDPGLTFTPTQNARIRVRVRHSGIGIDNPQLFVILRENGSDIFTSDKIEIPLTGPLNLEIDVGFVPSDFSVLSIAILDGASGGERRFRVYELELVIPGPNDETAGGSSARAAITGVGAIAGTGVGGSRASSSVAAVGALVGLAAGGSLCFATISAFGALAGTAAAGSSSAAVCGGVGGLVGIAASGSQAAAPLAGSGAVAGHAAGGSSARSGVGGVGSLAGVAIGGSRASIELPEIEQLGIYAKISRLVRERFNGAIASPLSLTTVYDNAAFNPAPTVTWARVRVRCDVASQIGLGNGNRYRKTGAATISIHTPLGTGVNDANAIAVQVVDAFRNVANQHVRFRSPSIRSSASNGKQWVTEVECPFYADVDVELGVGAALVTLPNGDEAQRIVRTRFKALWEALGYSVRFQNDPRDTPGLEEVPDDDETWAHFSIVLGESMPVEHAGTALTYRTSGIAFALLFFPVETGEENGLRVGDQVADHFRAVSVSGVTFKTPLVRGMQRQGPWWRVDVRAPFFWNEIA